MDILQSALDDYLEELPKEIKELDEDISEERLLEIIDESIEQTIPVTATKIWDTLKNNAPKMLEEKREGDSKFLTKTYKKWKKPFDLIEALNVICIEAGDEFNHSYRPTALENNNTVFDVVVRLHARACHISSEIICLLKNGFADGAHARWRALHEVACIGRFIKEHGNKAAKRYYDHKVIESFKGMRQHQRFADRIKPEAFTEEEVNNAKAEYSRILKKYDQNFKKGYGWASIFVANEKNTHFADIEKDVGLDHWRPYYKFASQNIHGGVKSLFNKLGLNKNEESILLVGQSDSGMGLPLHSTAISLFGITTTLLSIKPNLDRVIILKIIEKAVDGIEDSIVNTQTIT